MTARPDAKGFRCRTCGKAYEFDGWVLAHWFENTRHTCDSCGAVHRIREGNVSQRKRGCRQTMMEVSQ